MIANGNGRFGWTGASGVAKERSDAVAPLEAGEAAQGSGAGGRMGGEPAPGTSERSSSAAGFGLRLDGVAEEAITQRYESREAGVSDGDEIPGSTLGGGTGLQVTGRGVQAGLGELASAIPAAQAVSSHAVTARLALMALDSGLPGSPHLSEGPVANFPSTRPTLEGTGFEVTADLAPFSLATPVPEPGLPGGEPKKPWIQVTAGVALDGLQAEGEGALDLAAIPAGIAEAGLLPESWWQDGVATHSPGGDRASQVSLESGFTGIAEAMAASNEGPFRSAGFDEKAVQDLPWFRPGILASSSTPQRRLSLVPANTGEDADRADTARRGDRQRGDGAPGIAAAELRVAEEPESAEAETWLPSEPQSGGAKANSQAGHGEALAFLSGHPAPPERITRGFAGRNGDRDATTVMDRQLEAEALTEGNSPRGYPGTTRRMQVKISGMDAADQLQLQFLHRVRGATSGVDVRIQGSTESAVREIQAELPFLLERLEQSGFRSTAGETLAAFGRGRTGAGENPSLRGASPGAMQQDQAGQRQSGDAFADAHGEREQPHEQTHQISPRNRLAHRPSLWQIAWQSGVEDPGE